MNLTLAGLAEKGGFVAPPVAKEITWEQGGETLTGTVFVLHQGFASTMRFAAGIKDKEYFGHYIAAFIGLGEAGAERMTVEQADALDPALGAAMTKAITDVHGEQKNSLPPMKSGTNLLPTESAAAP